MQRFYCYSTLKAFYPRAFWYKNSRREKFYFFRLSETIILSYQIVRLSDSVCHQRPLFYGELHNWRNFHIEEVCSLFLLSKFNHTDLISMRAVASFHLKWSSLNKFSWHVEINLFRKPSRRLQVSGRFKK